MGYNPENVIDEVETRTVEEINQETKDKFNSLKKKYFPETATGDNKTKPKYSQKETDELFKKLSAESKKFKKLDAHQMDFSKPLEQTEVESGTMEFEVPCHVCGRNGVNRMCTCTIPYFKEIIIMAFTCNACGARSTDVKVGGGFSDKAKKYTFNVETEEDINRDLFKSETAAVLIPEIGLEVVSGSLGGIYSTVEGLVEKMLDTLKDDNPFVGDSSDIQKTSKF